MIQAIPTEVWLDILNAIVAATAELDGAKVHLYANAYAPTKDSILSDLTEATFSGYAPSSAVVWSAAHLNTAGQPVVSAGSKDFVSTAPFTVSNTVYGAYLTNGAGTKLLAVQQFDTPIPITAGLQGITVVPEFGPASTWGVV